MPTGIHPIATGVKDAVDASGKCVAARTGVEPPEGGCSFGQSRRSITQQKAGLGAPTVRNCHEKISRWKPLTFKAGNTRLRIYRCKSGGYRFFVVTYYLADRRIRKTFADLAKAKAHAHTAVASIISNQMNTLQLTNTETECYTRAVYLLKPLGVSLHAAVEEYIATRALNHR